MKPQIKKLEYVNVEHFLTRTSTLELKEAIILNMMWKRVESNNRFQDSILFLEKVSGISRQTIKNYIHKFKELNIINYVDGKYFFRTDYDEYLNEIGLLDRENEYQLNPTRNYYFTYTCYHFELAKKLELNEMQFFFLDIHIGLFSKKGSGVSPKNYVKRILGIEERYYFKLKNQLFKKGYLENCNNSDFIRVSSGVVASFVKTRKELKNPNRKAV